MKFDYNTMVLTGNFMLYFAWFLTDYKKRKRITPYGFIVLWYSLIAFLGVVSYALGLFSEVYIGGKNVKIKDLDILGFLMVFLSFYIFTYPLKGLRVTSFKHKVEYSKYFGIFETFSFYFSILLFVLVIPYTFQSLVLDAVDVYTAAREDGVSILPGYLFLLATLFKLLYSFFLPFCFYRIKNEIRPKYVIFLLIMFGNMIQLAIISASRGTIFVTVATFVFMFFLFKDLYKPLVKRVIVLGSSIFLGVSILFGIGITVSRSSDGSVSAGENILLYFGESFNHFGYKVWDDDKLIRTNGLIYFPSIYTFYTDKKIPKFNSTQDKVDYWAEKAGSRNHNNFAPIYGKLYMEFGPFIPLIIIAIFSFLVSRYFKHNSIGILQFPFLTYLFSSVFFYAIFSNPLRDDMLKDLVYTFLFILFLRKIIKVKAT